jgi:hypothetical protein
VINVTNFTSKNNPSLVLAEPPGPAPPARPAAPAQPPRVRPRVRLGDRWFTMNDTEAYWRGWQITKVQGGLGRRYRDPLFDTLAQCARCAGSGGGASAPCGPCLRTGRVSIDGVS